MDYKKFSKKIYSEFEGSLTSDEIDILLGIEDSFDKDSPISTDKRLVIRNLRIIGNKNSQDFEFEIKYEEGVNILVADNLKGKSSVFKVIKYALTGRNSLRKDILNWVEYVFLNFNINKKNYAVFLDLTNSRPLSKLFHHEVKTLEDVRGSDDKVLFEAKNATSFEDQIQNFFFAQFSYYSLKWTQKDSNKSSTSLNEAGASWATYFKSILLESKDSDKLMYGNQGKKIFEMLLSMELTYPINRLIVKRDKLGYEQARSSDIQITNNSEIETTANELEEKIHHTEEELKKLLMEDSNQQRIAQLTSEFNTILQSIERNNKERLNLYKKIEDLILRIGSSKRDIELLRNLKENLKKEINSSIKQKNSLEEFIHIGAFFSNLDVKHCPACDHKLLELRKQESVKKHECALCHEDVSGKDVDISVYKNKVKALDELIIQLKKKLVDSESKFGASKKSLNEQQDELKTIRIELQQLPDLLAMNSQLTQLDREISVLKSYESQNNLKNDLIARKAVFEYRLEGIRNKKLEPSENYDLKLSVINFAINELSKQRAQLGKRVTERLSSLMTQEVQALGLGSITNVLVNSNLDIKYEQSNEYITFNDFSEGEQLRAKLAFYLSLIQMDIEFNLGRHTRLLMIDSPAKEEADNSYLEGLSQLLKSIEIRFGSELQILIATAERDLEGVVTNQKIIPTGQYVF